MKGIAGKNWIVAGVALGAAAACGLFAQEAAAPLKFEVASIKPSDPDSHQVSILFQPGGGLRAMGASLKMLLTVAYDVRDFQISGGPGWMNSDRYDINAKAERSGASETPPPDPRKMTDAEFKTNGDQMRERLRALLADRFHLAVHRETKEAPIYALMVSKSGSKLEAAKDPAPDKPNFRGLRMGRGELTGQGATTALLANVLSNQLGRPVVDQTGLKGNFDFVLKWTPDPGQSFGPPGPTPSGVEAPTPPDPNGPSVFTAVQEQLGLRLESQKGPVEMIVVDRAEKPSDN